MKLKRIAALFLTAGLLLSLGACSIKPASVTTTAAVNQPTQTEAPVDATEEPLASYEITVWCDKSIVALTERQIEAFNAENAELRIHATVQGVDEDEAADQLLENAASGPDLYCFVNDRLAPLVKAGALDKLNASDAAFVKKSNDANAAGAAACDGCVYAYPMSADGCCFMYYDKNVIRNPASLEEIIADCEEAERRFCFDLDNSWYLASFFLGAGCVSDWTMNRNGDWTVRDSFDSDQGLVAMEGLHQALASPRFDSKSDVRELAQGAAVVVSGLWDAVTAKQLLGDKLGVATLPSFTVDDEDYELGSFVNFRMLGVKPQSDADRALVLHSMARWLTGTDAQLARFRAAAWAPSNLEAMQNHAVQSDPALAVMAAQTQRSVVQNAPADWWELAAPLSAAAREDEEDDWKLALQSYHDAVILLENLKPGLLFVGAWNQWNNAAVEDTYMLSGAGDLLSLTLEVPEDEDMSGRIVSNGKWENDKGYAQLTTGKELAVDLGDNNPDNNIVFAEPGTYTISINTTTNEITLEKLEPVAPQETEEPSP